jgi:chromate transporter
MSTKAPSWRLCLTVFGQIGLLSFGGPAAQIALAHRELVEKRGWLAEAEFLRALSFCTLLPGPEAMQLVTYAGWRLRGPLGGLLAGSLFILPGAALILALAALYGALGDLPLVKALFMGVQAAVLAIVAEALLRIGRRALKDRAAPFIAAAAFVALYAFALPFWVVVLAAGTLGFLRPAPAPEGLPAAPPLPQGHWRAPLLLALAWAIPLAALLLWEGGLLAEMAQLFSKLAIVTFGGAYAVLAALTQDIVTTRGWLPLGTMVDALGLAETTPGPLILVNVFVAYLAALKAGGVLYALAGAAVALWMTFIPAFLWVLAGAPFVEALTRKPRLAGALSAITAAVLGVIAALSLWLALHVLFGVQGHLDLGPLHLLLPDLASLRWAALVLALLAGERLLRAHWPLPSVLALCAFLSLLLTFFGFR